MDTIGVNGPNGVTQITAGVFGQAQTNSGRPRAAMPLTSCPWNRLRPQMERSGETHVIH